MATLGAAGADFAPPLEARPFAPQGVWDGPYPLPGVSVDPYGPNRFQAQAHNYCVSGCEVSYRTCLMSYVPDPSPYSYCMRARFECARYCQ